MTDMERIALAVASTYPTHFYTLSSANLTRVELSRCLELMVPRIRRRTSTPKRPIIYFGTVVKGEDHDGHHLHLLFWKRPHMDTFHGQTKALGLGKGKVKQIEPTLEDALRVTSYVLGQEQAVFGSKHHWRHGERQKGARRFRRAQRSTLARYQPELFLALDVAKDKSLSDKDMVLRLPTSIGSLGT